MITVVFAGTKGGSGRTTLSFALAVEAAREYGVLLADLDPQQSMADLWRRRQDIDNPMLVEHVKTVANAVSKLQRSGYARDLFVVDTPGSNMTVIREAISAANVVVLPVQPSPIDLLAQQAVVDLVDDLGKADRALFVLNRIDPRNDLGKEARRWLEKHHSLPVFEVAQRTAYVRAAVAGVAAGEIDKVARSEMSGLLKLVRELSHGKPKGA